jgi:hypothetical protein
MNYACEHPPLPLCEGERIKVRGSSPFSYLNPHPTLSLAKGEADNITGSCAEVHDRAHSRRSCNVILSEAKNLG